MKQNRRKFLSTAAVTVALAPLLAAFKKDNTKKMKNVFLHHVFFWLNDPGNSEDRNKLAEGLAKLSAVKTIRSFHIGVPASTNRDVIERGYALSWFVQFDNADDHAAYQTDPIHLKFIEECKHLWSKVIVYDSVDV